MAQYKDRDGNELTQELALALPPNSSFLVEWEPGKSVDCYRASESAEIWAVRVPSHGAMVQRGFVSHDAGWFTAMGLTQYKPQETFSAAARKFL